MADWREELRAQRAKTEAWIRQQNARLSHGLSELEVRGREVYAAGLKAGQPVVAKTSAQVRALGQAALEGRLPQVVGKAVADVAKHVPAGATASKRLGPPTSGVRQESRKGSGQLPAPPSEKQVLDQLFAGARGAQDALTLGAGDHVYAGARALADALDGQDIVRAYQARIATERARDQYDAKHFGAARATGQVVGTVAGLAALGPLDAALAGGVRMVEAAPLVAREVAALGGSGAIGGVASQGVEDFQRQQLGSIGDYAGSALGGAATALASARLGPGQAGALGGAVTSVAQDALNGRQVSLEKAGQAALGGGYIAAPFGLAGRMYSEGLHFRQKGKLGERLGEIRTRVNGGKPEPGGARVGLPSGRITVLDQESSIMPISEQKFGRTAKLTGGQREAYELYGPEDYRVDHFLPRDIGVVYGFPMGQLGYHEMLGGEE